VTRNWLLWAARGIARLALIGAVVGAVAEVARITREQRIAGVWLVYLVAAIGGGIQIVRGHR
jgi:hypothetical protein